MKTVPGFDVNDFPFIVCNGWEAFNLINVKDFHMEPLVKASVKTGLSQGAAFFRKESYGFSMHFTTQRITTKGRNLLHWHSMAFRQDIIQTLKKYGRLPYN